MTTLNLSLRLLRGGLTIEDALRPDAELVEHPAQDARLFISQAPPTQPRWFDFVSAFAREPLDRLNTMSCGAVLFLSGTVTGERTEGRRRRSAIPFTCAVTFGTAHHGLDPEAFERGFGLKVVLNAVTRSNLRGIDTATLDATTVQRRIQTSRNADLQTFGMDLDRDLLRLASGAPTDHGFASTLTGKDSLTLHKHLEPDELLACCSRAVTLFRKQDYQRDFGFIDHIVPVRDRGLVDTLDGLVFTELERLIADQPSDLHLALPDIIDPEETYEFSYYGVGLRPGSKHAFSEANIDDYVAELRSGNFRTIENMSALRTSHEIYATANGETDRRQKQRLYNCFVFEAEYDGHAFVLFDGAWFQIDREFYEQIEADFQRLLTQPFIEETEAPTERAFIEELNADDDLLNLDQVKLSPAGAAGANLEPCDFLSRSREFIHLKDGHGSAPISHLWNQGLVSIEAFVRDPEYRGALRDAVQRRQRKYGRTGFDTLLPNRRNRPMPANYPVIFGIMRKPYPRSGSLGLPFFSKVSLRSVASRIDSMGFPVQVHLIRKMTGAASEE